MANQKTVLNIRRSLSENGVCGPSRASEIPNLDDTRSYWNVLDIVDATLDSLSGPFDSLRSVELLISTLYIHTGFCGSEFDRTIEQVSTILDHISHPLEIVVSIGTTKVAVLG